MTKNAASTAATWSETTATIVNRDGARSVPAFVSPDAPGLAVTELREAEWSSAVPGSLLYSITHVASGCSVDGGLCYLRLAAQRVALELATLGDWTRDTEALMHDDELRRATARVTGAEFAATSCSIPSVAVARPSLPQSVWDVPGSGSTSRYWRSD